MKKVILIFGCLVALVSNLIAQENLPNVQIKSINGQNFDFAKLAAVKDTPIIVSFWATWCIPCITELESINDNYTEWQAIKPFKLIAVSTDDARTSKRVKPFVKGKGWQFEVFIDENNDLKRAVNVTDLPHVLIVKNGKIVYRHTGYVAGEEDNLLEKIKSL